MPDARERLLSLLCERAFERRKVVLSSGKESDFFIDCKQAVLSAEGHAWAGEVLYSAVLGSVDAVGGVELGGCPLASAVATYSALEGDTPIAAFYIRKQTKEHGSRQQIEGAKGLPVGARVAILEDVVTTGASTLRAVESARSAGLTVERVVALVDRLEGGAEAIRAAGLRFDAIFTRADFP